jgi:hypothetical protein
MENSLSFLRLPAGRQGSRNQDVVTLKAESWILVFTPARPAFAEAASRRQVKRSGAQAREWHPVGLQYFQRSKILQITHHEPQITGNEVNGVNDETNRYYW